MTINGVVKDKAEEAHKVEDNKQSYTVNNIEQAGLSGRLVC